MVEYTYDYLDRRIERKIDGDGSGGSNPADYYYNVYQGDNVALEIHDADGLADNLSSTGVVLEADAAVSHRYLYGAAVDEILTSEDASGEVLWGLADHEGTIRDVVDNAGVVQDHRQFDSFGNDTTATPRATDFLFGYTGQAFDQATGLYDYWHRWYDPQVGRMASEDPSGLTAGDLNLYRYVGNNPWNATDPTGLCYKQLGVSGFMAGYTSSSATGNAGIYDGSVDYSFSSTVANMSPIARLQPHLLRRTSPPSSSRHKPIGWLNRSAKCQDSWEPTVIR